ncbi:MAG: hybrid sensor histidine kinase/response regulator, partial [Prevotellaceae bacterium]|nr:hybrid sensor histidine kinase/response regulator [Prevotellaceae bacterium]
MKKTIENTIRFKAIIIYAIVVVVCSGIIYYIYDLNRRINSQKQNIEKYDKTLSLTNDLIISVQQAQSAVNRYLFSNRRDYIRQFQVFSKLVNEQIDTLISLQKDTLQTGTLYDIISLLRKKEATISELVSQFNQYSTLDTVSLDFQDYDPIIKTDSTIITTIRRDTIEHETPKKNFWGRLGNLFSSSSEEEKIFSVVTTTYTNTYKNVIVDTVAILSDVRKISEQTNQSYLGKIEAIERQVGTLIATDQSLSEELSQLLLELHRQTLDSTLDEINKSEEIIQKNYAFSIAAGVISLLLILVLIFLIIVDVNKGDATRKALEEEKKRTEDLMKSRHELLLAVSHDIKAPLTSILGYLGLFKKEKGQIEEVQQQVSSMENSAYHILSLLTNLLEFSRLEQGKIQVTRCSFNVKDLCREIMEMFSPIAHQKGIVFKGRYEVKELQYASADRLKLKQIIINLLSNALKYTIQGEVSLAITEKDSNLCFEITDSGVGMPSDLVEEMFKPFSRTERGSSVAEGSGFGLYVVKGLVNVLNGTISIASEESAGTKVEVRIPVDRASSDEVKPIVNESEEMNIDKHYNLLLIDDDISLLTMLNETLKKLGCFVTICRNILELENCLPHITDYDMVITDMNMGDTTGADVLQKVREQSASIPVIVMTAHDDFNLIDAKSIGFNGYLSKPFSNNLLINLLNRKVGVNMSGKNFSSLHELFDGDEDAIKNVLRVFVEDIPKAVLASFDNEDSNNKIYFLADPKPYSWLDFATIIA